jgi:hypothetical protein
VLLRSAGQLTPVWRNKATSRAEDELLIFPGEATFERVAAVSWTRRQGS